MRRAFFSTASVLVVALFAALPGASRPARAQEAPPNILIVMTDDQRADHTLGVMPETTKYFEGKGTTFSNAMATTPLCCPSRASIFTGRYAHNHKVRNNGTGAARALDQETTSQYYLQQAGYRTGIFGKYLNGWDLANPPPYFDEYAIMKRGYYSTLFGLQRNGTHIQREVSGYTTSFISHKAADFIKNSEADDDRPWLMYVTPFAPHHPAMPLPRHWFDPVPDFEPNPAMLEEDLSDKPPQLEGYTEPFDEARLTYKRERQLRTLMAVDELFENVTDALEDAEETNTLVIFMSDNGFMWGEHGFIRKGLPYLPSLRIPLMMRWDGQVLSGIDERLAANMDIAPTVLDAANVTPDHDVDGKSLLEEWDREEILTEVFGYESRPDVYWASILSLDFQYVEYYEGTETVPLFREYYDLNNDPWQLENLFGDGDLLNDPDFASLSSRLAGYRKCPLLNPCP